MIKKTLVTVMLAGSLCIIPCMQGKAAEIPSLADDGMVSVCNLYSSSIVTTLSISDNLAYVYGNVIGVPGTTTKIHIKLILQRYSKGKWSAVETCEKTISATNGSLSGSKSVSSGKYRVKGVYTVYKNSKSEQTTSYSSPVSF